MRCIPRNASAATFTEATSISRASVQTSSAQTDATAASGLNANRPCQPDTATPAQLKRVPTLRVAHAGTGEVLTVTPPTWRPDLTDPADLVEEVVRLEPPFNFHYRVVKRACQLGGYDLEPEDRVEARDDDVVGDDGLCGVRAHSDGASSRIGRPHRSSNAASRAAPTL